MSADRYTFCPRCRYNHTAAAAALHTQAREAYGRVTPNQYLELVRQAEAGPPSVEKTLREDFSIGLSTIHGVFVVDYKAGCEVCGFHYEYKYTEEAWEPPETILLFEEDDGTAN